MKYGNKDFLSRVVNPLVESIYLRGRKSLRDEATQANVINLSWTTILRALRSNTLTEEEKRGIALEVVKRSIPQNVKVGGDAENPITMEVTVVIQNENSLTQESGNRISRYIEV